MTMSATRPRSGGRPHRAVDLAEVAKLLSEGLSLRQTARKMRMGYGTSHRAVQAAVSPVEVIQNSEVGIL